MYIRSLMLAVALFLMTSAAQAQTTGQTTVDVTSCAQLSTLTPAANTIYEITVPLQCSGNIIINISPSILNFAPGATLTITGSITINAGNGSTVTGGTILTGGTLTLNTGSVLSLITNCQQLQAINNNLSGNYVLLNDIDCTGVTFTPIGTNAQPFQGTLDGQGNIITGLTINLPGADDVGLFAFTGSNSQISNVGLVNDNISSANTVGALVGFNWGSITNCYSAGSVSGNGYIGGLVGLNNTSGAISNSYNTGSVFGNGTNQAEFGGLVGSNDGLITTSYNTGSVTASGINFAGLVGLNNGPIINAYNTGSVSGSGTNVGGLGGLVGENYSSITNSYNAGSISGNGVNVGGLVGESEEGLITNSFSIGSVSGSSGVGGLVGFNGSTITNSGWWTGSTLQAIGNGGTVTYNESDPTDFFNSQLGVYMSGSPAWDFTDTWVADGQHYPVFIWQEQPQINLWNTFSAAGQADIFEPASPQGIVNWGNIEAVGVNWTDLLILSKPAVWNYQSATPVPGFLNSVNWNDLGSFSNAVINWGSVTVLSRSGIDWASVNPLVKSGINWSDWFVATTSDINWNNVSVLSRQGINWNSLGTLCGDVNWSGLSVMSKQGINWSVVGLLSNANVNWDSASTLNEIPITPMDLHTLRTIGVNPDSSLPAAPTTAELALNLTGNASGTFTSSPGVGGQVISCTSGSGLGCSAAFPLNQPVTLNFTSISNSIVTNWGGCTPVSATSCTIIPDQPAMTLSIAVNPTTYTITASVQGIGGTISPSGVVNVLGGGSQNFTMTASTGYAVGAYTIDGNFSTGSIVPITTASYTFSDVTSSHTIVATFIPVYNLNIQTTGSGTGTLSSTSTILCASNSVPIGSPVTSPWTTYCSGSYLSGTVVTMTETPNSGSVFNGWTGIPGCSTQSSCTFTVSSNISATANFIQTYAVNLNTYGAGSATFLCNGSSCPASPFSVNQGTSMVITAQLNPGTIFETWNNTCTTSGGTASGATCTVNNIKANINLTAILGLAPPTYTVTTSTAGPGSGSLYCNGSPCPASPFSVTSGKVITFTGDPKKGSILEGLGGVCGAPGGPIFTCPVDVTSNIIVSAYFIKSPPPAPIDLKSVSSAKGIALTWGNQYGVSFNVYRAQTGINGDEFTLIKTVEYPNTSYTDNTLVNDGRYRYYVTGIYYPNIESPKSKTVAVNWEDPNLPTVPTGLTAATITGQVDLSWKPSVGADQYDVKRALANTNGSAGQYVIISVVNADPADKSVSYDDRSVVNGKTYFYMIAAQNDKGTSSYTAAVSIKAK